MRPMIAMRKHECQCCGYSILPGEPCVKGFRPAFTDTRSVNSTLVQVLLALSVKDIEAKGGR